MRKLCCLVALGLLAGCNGGAAISVVGAATNLFKARQTPAEFRTAVLRFEGLRGTDDADPAVVFDLESGGGDPAIVDLTEADQDLYSGEISSRYLGTYTHCRITVVAAGQEIRYQDAGGNDRTQRYLELLQAYDNSAGTYAQLPAAPISRGDVLLDTGAGYAWFEIDASRSSQTSTIRSALQAYQDPNPGEAVQTIELADPVTIESGGAYTFRISFDVTETFEYGDRDSDGIFEPLSDDHDGTVNGFDFQIRVPGVSITGE